MNRAQRRHNTQVKKARAKRLLEDFGWRDIDDKRIAIAANDFSMCSCWMCCNRRKIEGKSLSEKRSEDSHPI